MDMYAQIAEKIIKEQETIIGPIALEQAQKVSGLKVDSQNQQVSFEGDKKMIIDNLVKKYQDLFGQASVEVCRQAVRSIIADAPQEQVPALLR